MKNFRRLRQTSVRLRSESIVILEYVDAPEITKIAGFIASMDESVPYRLDAYIPVPGAPWRRPTPEEMEQAVAAARRSLDNVSVLHSGTRKQYDVVQLV